MRWKLATFWLLLLWSSAATTGSGQTLLPDSVAGWPCISESYTIGTITFSGNSSTQPYILKAELDLEPGIQMPASELPERLEQNRVRLINLQLFHWVKAEVISCHNGVLDLHFSMQERWYIWPALIFSLADRNLNVWLSRPSLNRVDYGLSVKHYNFRGRNEKLKVKVQHGFNRVYELSYSLPRLIQSPKWGLFASVLAYQSHFLDYTTQEGRVYTYRNDNEYPVQALTFNTGTTYRPDVKVLYQAGLGFISQKISDSVLYRNPNYILGRTNRDFLQLELLRTFNVRNTFSYPLSGRYVRMQIRQLVPLGGGANFLTILNARQSYYYPLGKGFYYAVGIEGEVKLANRIAYADNRAFGYSTYVRGYELRVADGQHFGLIKQGLSYGSIRNRVIKVPLLKNPKFNRVPISVYLNAFIDAGYARDDFYQETNLRTTNQLLIGTGLGLHFVTYYDKVLTFEYSVNRDREGGFFIRTGFPI